MARAVQNEVRGNARGRETRRRLLDAASATFAEHGWTGTRVADIAAAADVSQGGFYRHFPDRRAIFLEAVATPVAELLAVVEDDEVLRTTTVDEAAIRAMALAFFRTYAEHRELVRVLRDAAATREDDLAARWAALRGGFVGAIAAWLERLHRAGAIAVTDPGLLADALGSVVDQLAYVRIGVAARAPDDAELERLAATAARVWTGALLADG